MTSRTCNLSGFSRKCLVQRCTNPEFFSRGMWHLCKAGFFEIRLCASLQRPFFRKFCQENTADCHFYKNTGFTVLRIAIFPEILALQTLHMPVFFFQRHSASRKSIFPGKSEIYRAHQVTVKEIFFMRLWWIFTGRLFPAV